MAIGRNKLKSSARALFGRLLSAGEQLGGIPGAIVKLAVGGAKDLEQRQYQDAVISRLREVGQAVETNKRLLAELGEAMPHGPTSEASAAASALEEHLHWLERRLVETADSVLEVLADVGDAADRQQAVAALGIEDETPDGRKREDLVVRLGALLADGYGEEFRALLDSLGDLRRECCEAENPRDAERLGRIQDALLWLGFSEEVLASAYAQLSDRSCVLVEARVGRPVGAGVVMAHADGVAPSFVEREGEWVDPASMRGVRAPIGNPAVAAKAIEMLRDLASQVSVGLDDELASETDPAKRIAGWARQLRRGIRYRAGVQGRRCYCLVRREPQPHIGNRLIQVLGVIRSEIPELAFIELDDGAVRGDVEHTILRILGDRSDV